MEKHKKAKQKEKNNYATKKIIFLIGLLILVFIPFGSCTWEWDNIGEYDEEIQTITIVNALGLPLIREDIATIKLNTPTIHNVIKGEERLIGETTFNNLEDYNNIFNGIESYDENDNGKKIEREFIYKYKETYQVEVDDYERECDKKVLANETIIDSNCRKIVIGSHYENRHNWLPFDEKAGLLKGEITIGIFTDVYEGDYIEWIPQFYGVKIDEWAVWKDSFNTDLVAYYKLDGVAGAVVDSVGNYDGVNYGAVRGLPGLINKSFNFSSAHVNASSIDLTANGGIFTFNLWYNGTSFGNPNTFIEVGDGFSLGEGVIIRDTGTGDYRIHYENNTQWDVTSGAGFQTNRWDMLTLVGNSSHFIFYENGTELDRNAITFVYDAPQHLWLADYHNLGWRHQGVIDEVGVWTRALNSSEILELYNGGAGITKQPPADPPPSYSGWDLANNSNYTTHNINANATWWDNYIIYNVSVYVNGLINETDNSGINNTLYDFDLVIPEGTHLIHLDSWDNASNQNTTEVRYVNVDTNIPKINITSPFGNFYHASGNNITLYWNYTEINPDTCRYKYRGVNTTITCGDNVSIIEDVTGINNVSLFFYSNDTFGHSNNFEVTWNYSLWENDRGFHNATLEGSPELYYLDFTILSGSLSTARFWYEGNNTASPFSLLSSRRYNATLSSFVVPLTNANKVSSFFWEINYGATQENSSTSSQHINAFAIDDCSTNTIIIYNFTMAWEDTRHQIVAVGNNTLAQLELNITTYSSSQEVLTFNKSYSQKNPFQVCINDSLGATQYNINTLVEYQADGLAIEFYNIQNETLNASVLHQNYTLYDLNTTISQSFKLIVKDSSFLSIEDALVEVWRKYVGLGAYRIVEIPKTDAKGETNGQLVVDDVIYKFVIKKFGRTISTFTDVKAICQNPTIETCTIDFNAFASSITIPDFEANLDFNFTLDYDETSKVVSSIFLIPSGTPGVIVLNVTRTDALSTAVCIDTLTSSSGTLSCTIPSSFGNASVYATLYKDGIMQSYGQIKLDQKPEDIYGVVMVTLALFIMLTLIGAGMSNNPVFSVIFLLVGVILLFSLNLVANDGFFGAGATFLFIAVATILIIIKGANR